MIKAITLTALQNKVTLPPQFELEHDADKKIEQLREFVFKFGKYKDLSCDCHLCEKLRAKTVEPVLRSLLLECLYVDLSEAKFEFQDNTAGAVLMQLVDFAALRIGINDLEVHIKTAGGQIAFTVQRGEFVRVYNANPDLVIKTLDTDITSFIGTGEVESSPVIQSYVVSLGYIARERQELVLSIVLYKTKTVDIFLVKNENVASGDFCGPIQMFRMLPIQYNLTTTSSIKLLIKHLGAVLFHLYEKLKAADVESPEDIVEEITGDVESPKDVVEEITELPAGMEPPRKNTKK